MNPLRVCAYCISFIAAEVLLYISYRHHDARFHWFLHFFVGASAALIMMSMWALRSRRPAPYPLIWILVAHLVAMFPDILFLCCSIIHRAWMDAFLWHLGAHFLPGRNWSWYAIFVNCLGGYMAVLAALASSQGKQKATPAL